MPGPAAPPGDGGAGPIRDGERLFSVARLDGAAMGVLVLHDPVGTAEKVERVAIEHATTVLTMELARLQTLAEADARMRGDLVAELVEGADLPGVLNRAQALGYDLGRPHQVVVVMDVGGRRTTRRTASSALCAGPPRTPGSGRCLPPGPAKWSSWPTPRRPGRKFRAAVLAEWPGRRLPDRGGQPPQAGWTSSRCPTRKRSSR